MLDGRGHVVGMAMRWVWPGEALRPRKLYKTTGQAPRLPRRTAMFVAVTTAKPKVQPAPRTPQLPMAPGTAGQERRDLAASLQATGPRPGPPAATRSPGDTLPRPIPSQFPLRPPLSASQCTAHSSADAASIFLNTCCVHCPRCRSEPSRQNAAPVELTLWRVEVPFRRKMPFLCLLCRFLAWQALPLLANPSSPFQRHPSQDQCPDRGGTAQHGPDAGCCIAPDSKPLMSSLVLVSVLIENVQHLLRHRKMSACVLGFTIYEADFTMTILYVSHVSDHQMPLGLWRSLGAGWVVWGWGRSGYRLPLLSPCSESPWVPLPGVSHLPACPGIDCGPISPTTG